MAESTTTTACNTCSGGSSSSNPEDSTTDDVLQPSKKKLKRTKTGRAGSESNWKLPPHITRSRKGIRFASCKLCQSDFSVSHGGFNDTTRHVKGSIRKPRRTLRHQASPISYPVSYTGSYDIIPGIVHDIHYMVYVY